MKLKALASAALSVIVLGLSTQAHAHGEICGVLYEDSNYGGHAYLAWGLNSSSSNLAGSWNDRVSSVYVGPGCTMKVWLDSNYEGLTATYTASQRYVGDSVNDKITSYTCSCRY